MELTSAQEQFTHDYLGVDYEIVWDVVENKIPVLRREIGEILRKENAPEK
jgi:uncharacterized protein with HEPN domain